MHGKRAMSRGFSGGKHVLKFANRSNSLLSHQLLASHAGVFRGARISSLSSLVFLPGREEIRAPLKTPAWEANQFLKRVQR